MNLYCKKYIEFLETIVDSVSIKLSKLEDICLEIKQKKKEVELIFQGINKNPASIALFLRFEEMVHSD